MEIITELKEGVFGLQMNRPENKNALTLATYSAMAPDPECADRDPAARVVLVHGHPDAFSSDADSGDFLHSPAKGSPVLNFISAIGAASKPIAAAVSGLAIGIGITMLPHIERVYAAETPRFQLQIWSETVGSSTQLRSPEPAAAMKAFFEKGPPNFAQLA
jgi:enoyl-CoA hydratase/carnithine racemase